MKLRVLILGYGEMGHAMEFLLAKKHDVRVWNRAGKINLEEETSQAQVILFCLPVSAHFEIISRVVAHLASDCLCLSIAKGLDEFGRTAPQVLGSVLSGKSSYGVIYGPMIAEEILLGHYAFADVALSDVTLSGTHDFSTVRQLFLSSTLICKQVPDMLGSSWLAALKNVYAIMFGIAEELELGDNMRGYLMVTAVSEIANIAQSLGAQAQTVYSYAGLGDLLTTASSKNSHHHQLGRKLASMQDFELTGEGVNTLQMIEKFNLFDAQTYPLFSLIGEIVAQPKQINFHLGEYFKKISAW